MRLIKQLSLGVLAILAVFAVAACGNNHSDKKASDSEPKEQVKHKDTKKKATTKKKKSSNKGLIETDEKKKPQTQTGANNNAATQQPTQSNNNGQTPAPIDRIVNTPDDAVSLFVHSFGMSDGGSAYSAQPTKGGFIITPKESAYGHSQTFISYDGNAYSLEGKLLRTFDEMAAPNDKNRPESGWHGY
ncbi:hypothetical protein [Companilactobacillus ginsenosidimutans]|uniref:Lipoprotein n=1 Tax=Companilactobacillus ginsenosidimutans TaxID=1007676 RepID=A0A0H4R250_9LACO|nr:hypothetical protein [Companilactobacillus ginsenosidimutans]AKP67815.1 hypothetical protein ABM34_09915 [Companilactobacillus ginsenosidimutans]